MDNPPPGIRDNQNPSFLILSPNSQSSHSSGTGAALHHPSPSSPRPPQPPSLPIPRSEPNNPYPTTFVQADTTSFKKVVQMLTGSSETTRQAARPDAAAARNPIPLVKTAAKKDRSSSKLYERRNSLKSFKISPLGYGLASSRPEFLAASLGSPRNGTPEILSPSILDFPSLVLSPVTPLIPDPFNRSPHTEVVAAAASSSFTNIDMEAEDKAIKEKGFYLHQSPATTPRDTDTPRLLPLFPMTSPRLVSGSANAPSSSC